MTYGKPGKLKVKRGGTDARKARKSAAETFMREVKNRIQSELPQAIDQKWKPLFEKEAVKEGIELKERGELAKILTPYQFKQLPLSDKTLAALKSSEWRYMSVIQKAALPHALAGFDVMGEAPTGSGKTLAYVIPVLELLWREDWSSIDGCGALILAPTRELTLQIFEVLRHFKDHDFSVISVFGGKFISQERGRVNQMNIIIGTPGRVQQHLQETAMFHLENLKVLVLDEVDKLIEFGFADTLREIAASLPPKDTRQTFMFSATLSAEVRNLMKEFCREGQCVHVASIEESGVSTHTPTQLQHTYCKMELQDKLSVLYSFLSRNFKAKILVFVSSVKQCRYIYEAFRQLRTGAKLLEMHGSQDQGKRIAIFDEFNRRTRAITLIATDVVGRGVDFPGVDWVIQMDCPPDVETYIHRVGRTARGVNEKGHGCLFLLPSEMKFVSRLKEKLIDIREVRVKINAKTNITYQLSAINARQPAIRHLASKFFISYIRSIRVMRDKEVFQFDVLKKSWGDFATSLGLPQVPDIGDTLGTTHTVDTHPTLDGGIDVSLKPKTAKHMSKLEKLKEKIKAKKAAKKAGAQQGGEEEDTLFDEEDLPAEKKSAHAKRLERVQNLRLKAKTVIEDNDGEEPLVQIIDTQKPEAETSLVEELAIHRAVMKGKIVIKADGTAKLKGAAKLGDKTHIFFDDNDDDELVGHDVNTFEGLAAVLQNQSGSDSENDDPEIAAAKTPREKYIMRLKKSLEQTKKQDKKRARERRERIKEAEKIKMAKLESGLAAPVAVTLGNADSE
eukprot:Blabericola_migrator_1__10921@NODE_630_length_7163_cov_61_195603_g461_i0_p1_GENE_NODE_630_length_7163_cov_61_195603_g461_i0NODE_630_length_7163_cov_61_195603_g461_i0_p1_ORF_typecomplete_len789_score204_41DEAD/PF00270_29/1_1e43DEAD/PF00270_29/1_4e03Helicase_C/PF00271_31/6_1e26ResIII/PF04851_15/6e14ResIII/PF04851_15/8_5e02ERCC3_RAD25_C/PF16203_5/3_6e09DUF4217/PF13959_6/8_7e08CMS1/PF14617_6/5_5e03CMS1/PF14617_6/2_9e05CMS1/PF14617_6/7_7e02CMS1/PF14617_6/1e03AAA_19/PF13245_6/0_069AAA_19/PF13245_6/3_3